MRLASSTSNVSVITEHGLQENSDPRVGEQMAWSDDSPDSSTERINRNDEFGNVIGYSLITETEWDTTVDSYDLGDNLISRSYTNLSGYSHSFSWEPSLELDGEVVGSTTTYASSEGSYSDSHVEIHDAEGNLRSSSYRNSHGDWAITTRVTPPEQLIGPAPLSHALQTTGARSDGSTYQRTELFDINGNLVRSESAYSDGSTEDYGIMPVSSEDGGIQGYLGTWTWIDTNGNVFTWSNHLDNQLNSLQMYSHTAVTTVEPTYLTFEPEISICTFPVPDVHVDLILDEHVNPVDIQPDDFGDHDQYQDPRDKLNPLRLDHLDELGNATGYSLINETEWGKTVEHYDLDENLVSSTHTDCSGYTHSFTWEPILDASGTATGARHTSISSDGSYSAQWVEIYDSESNLISSTYSSSDGDWETTTRTAPHEISIGPALLSHTHLITGARSDGSTHQRNELFDINGNLVRSESFYSDGSSDLYTIEPVFSENGDVKGYSGIWTWTDQYGGISSSSAHLDTELNPSWQPIVCPMPTPTDSDGEDAIWLEHCFTEPESTPVLYSSVELHGAYAFRDLSTMDELAELAKTDQPLVPDQEEPLASGEAEPLANFEADSVDWTADDLADGDLISTSNPPDILAPASSIEQFITSEFIDLKLNVREHQDVTHGMLLGELDLGLRGNKLNNVFVGNTGNNKIAGGLGKDLVTGGDGADQFTFRNQRRSFDTITDFNAAEDKFLLNGRVFRDLFTSSGLRKDAIGSSLILDQTTGYLLFSPNGNGSNSRPIKLALLPGLEVSDFSAELFLFG
jgi:hypothetical protein